MRSQLQALALPVGSLKAWQIPFPTCEPQQVSVARDGHHASDVEDVGLSTLFPSHVCVRLQKQLLSGWRGWGWPEGSYLLLNGGQRIPDWFELKGA